MPSAISNRTTSPSSLRPTRWASVPPIWPAPINAILLRAMWGKPSLRADEIRLGQSPMHCVIAPFGAAVQVAGDHVLVAPDHSCGGGTRGPRASGFHHAALRRGAGGRISPAMRQGQVGLRAHLDQARGGPLEFPRLEAVMGEVEHVGF